MPLLHATRGFWSIGRPLELPYAPGLSCTAQPRAHGSKFQLHPSSWAQVEPVLRLRLTSPEVLRGAAARVAIAVLMTFHSMTTTDSVESIDGRLAKSLSAVLNPPTSSPKGPGGRV